MVVDRKTRETVREQLQQQQPLMNVTEIKKDFLLWLADLRFPGYPNASSWEDCLRTFPPTAEEGSLVEGRKIRLALQLYTSENQYVISIIENFEPSSRGTYSICVHVNWKIDEWRKQKALESGYTGKFDDLPKARHVIWAQTFRLGGLLAALNACAIAILGNELTGSPRARAIGETLQHPGPASLNVPTRQED